MKGQKLINALILTISVIALATSIAIFFLGKNKIAYVNTSQLMSELKTAKKLQYDVEQMKKNAQQRVDTLSMEFETALKKYEKEISKMTPKEKQLSKELLQVKQRQLVDYEKAIRRKNMDEEQRMTQIVLEKVNGYITEYGKSKGYDIIFGTTGGNIVYAVNSMDLTKEIIEGLNRQSKSE